MAKYAFFCCTQQYLNGVIFKVKTILAKKVFGTRFIWSGKVKIAISDPAKTIIDGLNDPAVFGGIRMVADVLSAYVHSKELILPEKNGYYLNFINKTHKTLKIPKSIKLLKWEEVTK